MRKEFIHAIKNHQTAFDVELPDEVVERLADFYDLIREYNPLLHLVGPCSPEEFAVRHILESLTLLEYLPAGAKFTDVGAGAGLPSLPCVLVREGLKAVLIESKEKKAAFLARAVNSLGILERTWIVNRQFEEATANDCHFVTCRALDRFIEKLPKLIRWSGKRKMLLFGGPKLGEALRACRVHFSSALMPMSRQRFLFVSDRS